MILLKNIVCNENGSIYNKKLKFNIINNQEQIGNIHTQYTIMIRFFITIFILLSVAICMIYCQNRIKYFIHRYISNRYSICIFNTIVLCIIILVFILMIIFQYESNLFIILYYRVYLDTASNYMTCVIICTMMIIGILLAIGFIYFLDWIFSE